MRIPIRRATGAEQARDLPLAFIALRNSPFAGSCWQSRSARCKGMMARRSSLGTALSISVRVAAGAWWWSAQFRDRGRQFLGMARQLMNAAVSLDTLAIFTVGAAEGRGVVRHAAPAPPHSPAPDARPRRRIRQRCSGVVIPVTAPLSPGLRATFSLPTCGSYSP